MGAKRNNSKPAAAGADSRILWRPKVWAGMLLLIAIGFCGHLAWRHYAPVIARHPQFQLTAERIHITPPPPPWIHTDIKADVLRDAGLAGSLSVLEDGAKLQQRLRDTFGFHPWIAAVRRISLSLPASLEVELEYRRPVAAVAAAESDGVSFLPIDVTSVRLPDADFSDAELRSLPRITDVTGRPAVGDTWNDPRVVGGARLAAALAPDWNNLRLVEIIPSQHTHVRGDARFYTFEILSGGGTRIVWGAAPGEEQLAGESPFDMKRQRLVDYADEQGRLDSIDGPELVDVRSELVVVPRTARRAPAEKDQAKQTK